MRKVISCLLVTVLCLAMALTAFANAVEFVPSITYKPAPEVTATSPEGHEDCIIVTPVSKADESEDISAEDAAELKQLYADLTKEGTKLSAQCPDLNDMVADALGENKTADDLVVRDLFHIGTDCDDLKTYMGADGTVKVTFASTVDRGESVFAMMYVDGAWEVIEAVNNQDGTITVSLTEWGTLALMVPAAVGSDDTQTGESTNTVLWVVVMGAAMVAMVLSIAVYRRRASAK